MMMDFLENNSIYIVLFIVVAIWSGIFIFLLGMDRRISQIEKELRDSESERKSSETQGSVNKEANTEAVTDEK